MGHQVKLFVHYKRADKLTADDYRITIEQSDSNNSLPMTTYQHTEPVRFSSRAEAEAWAAGWLRNLETESDYEWEREPHGSVACELAPGVPARVVGMAASVGEEWAPSAIFTVGVKYEGRYWQGRVGEWDRPGTLSGATLVVLDAILKVLGSAARTSLPAPTTVSV